MPFRDFVRANFDKLLMSLLFLITTGFLLHVVHHGSDSGTISWIENTDGQILAALLTLVVSKQFSQRQTDINTNTGPGTQVVGGSGSAPGDADGQAGNQ